ncbi:MULTISPECIES: hypothetical protein [Streptomyces]|uniref:Uncharacterized protein n=1 Tax=Streptomyces ramulosus TaxID=47762 RepID=A0ABW1FFJ9_9ACTN
MASRPGALWGSRSTFFGWECAIRDLIFVEAARMQFDALTERRKADAGKALLTIAQEANRGGVWRSGGDHRLTVTYEVHPAAIVVTEVSTAQSTASGPRQPYQGMEMRHEGRRWIHLNPHEE